LVPREREERVDSSIVPMLIVAPIITALTRRGESLAVAESITGGGLGAAITSVPGSSEVFAGGIIAYQLSVKRDLLKVPSPLLEKFGVVSEEVAVAMAEGLLKLFGTTWAIATTGVAGPGPSDGVTAGTVWIAIRGPVNQSTELAIQGEREIVRNASVSSAIIAFARILAS
jgi:nicotinamide-nucleotide amidase